MALNAATLQGLITANLAALGPALDAAQQLIFAQAMANAIVTHLTTSGACNVVISSGSSAGSYNGTIV